MESLGTKSENVLKIIRRKRTKGKGQCCWYCWWWDTFEEPIVFNSIDEDTYEYCTLNSLTIWFLSTKTLLNLLGSKRNWQYNHQWKEVQVYNQRPTVCSWSQEKYVDSEKDSVRGIGSFFLEKVLLRPERNRKFLRIFVDPWHLILGMVKNISLR